MKRKIDDFLSRQLVGWNRWVFRHSKALTWTTLALTLVLGGYTLYGLGINSDNVSLVPTDLPSRRAHESFIKHFPNLEEAIFVVVDGDTPQRAREATQQLILKLQDSPDTITEAYLPGGGDFFERNGLLYRTPEELEDFADAMARIQPLVGELEASPKIHTLARLIQEGLRETETGRLSEADWATVLDRLSEATTIAWNEAPVAISWEEILMRGSALETSTRGVIVVHPILNYADILTGRRPMASIRDASVALGLTPERGVLVRITGNPALNYDEMIGIAWDVGVASLFCFILVAFVLHRALRSIRLVVAVLATLGVGLIWTAAFTAAAVGTLNPLSVTFAILIIGLGVDFAIHLGIVYVDHLRAGIPHREALEDAVRRIGATLVLCTLTTGIGFLVFVPTRYRGVSELGLIAGAGMFIILWLTLSFFPALLNGFLRIDEKSLAPAIPFRVRLLHRLNKHPAAVRRVAALLGVGSLLLIPQLEFSANVIEMRDPDTESVQAFRDLMSNPDTSPWYLNILVPDLKEAVALAPTLEALPEVSHVVTARTFVPTDQAEKMEILEDTAFLFDNVAGEQTSAADPDVERELQALRDLHENLDDLIQVGGNAPLNRSLVQLREHLSVFLARVQTEPDPGPALIELETILLGPFPDHLTRLRKLLNPQPVALETLPRELRERMLAPDGTARVQVYPESDLHGGRELRHFVETVQKNAPNVAGVPLNLVEFAEVIRESFTQALVSAVIIISVLLFLLWLKFSDVLLVMIPLSLGAALTVATAVLLGIHFDFTNVVVIPLLFGIGVDSAIHMVQRAKEMPSSERDLLGTSTARAVFYSALTTDVSFGTLALAGQKGLASLGILLTIGLLYTVAAVLILLPALLELRSRMMRKKA